MPESETVAATKTVRRINPVYGARFRQGRKVAKVGPLAIAQALGISEQAVLQFELGKQRFDLERFAAACDLAHLNTEWVLFGRGEMFTGSAPIPASTRPARRVA